jgi:hypothetical protein
MTPATHIRFNDAHTEAWMLAPDFASFMVYRQIDRQCDMCYGRGTCVLCDGTGRHTFTIDIECPVLAFEGSAVHDHPDVNPCPVCSGVTTYRVSVVPGMVLPIVAWDEQKQIATLDHFIATGWKQNPEWAVEYRRGAHIGRQQKPITLPSAATPGKHWAVKLEVHS